MIEEKPKTVAIRPIRQDEVGTPAATIQDWELPASLTDHSVPEFPVASLPSWVRHYVEELSVSSQTPPDLAGTLSLGLLGIGPARRVEITRAVLGAGEEDGGRDHVEPLNLYTIVVLRPGTRKSAVMNKLRQPILEFQRQRRNSEAVERGQLETKIGVLKKKHKDLIRQAGNAGAGDEELQAALDLEDELFGLESGLSEAFVLVVDDVTPERVGEMICQQRGRLVLMSTEGGIFDTLAGRYSDSHANLDVFLKSHCGDAYRRDRVGRGTWEVERPALSVCLTIQPEVLAGLLRNKVFRGRGLLGRFLYSMPADTLARISHQFRPRVA